MKKILTTILTVILLLGSAAFVSTANAADYTLVGDECIAYNEDGSVIGHFSSMEEFEAFYTTVVSPLAYTCDTAGHVHGSRTTEQIEVVPVETSWGIEYRQFLATYCYWCGSLISRVSI